MKKSDFWKVVWIPVNKRLPPKDQEKWVITWNYFSNCPIIMKSFIARCSAIAEQNGEWITWDRKFSHWAFVEPPKKERKRKL